jgi:predicted Zn-dependent protease with MMP-like domain
MQRKAFEKLVQEAVTELPPEFRDRLQNVVIIVEDRPSQELVQQMEIEPNDTLFGFYEGVPLTQRGFDSPFYPDRILIFQEPLENACETDEDLKEEVKITIAHEIAHFFGLDDDYLDMLGY